MDDVILEFISQYIELSEEEKRAITSQNLIVSYKKGEVLLSEGQMAKDCFFVLKGCVRSYYLVDGEERTTEFYSENDTINPVSYLNKEPSAYYLDCLEDTVISLGNEERNRALLENVPRLAQMVMQMTGTLLAKNHSTLDDFKNLSPEERYRKLLKERPELFQRVQLYHIASYLGITPVSLSRMRKRIGNSL